MDDHKGITQPGQDIEYQISATINSDNVNTLKGFAIYDQPNKYLLAPKKGMNEPATMSEANAADTIVKVEVLNKDGGVMQDHAFINTDYKVVFSDTWKDKNDNDPAKKTVFVKFTDTGLKKLAAAKKADPKAEARVTFKFNIDKNIPANTTVANEGGFIPGKATDPWSGNTDDPTPPANGDDTVPNDPNDNPEFKFGAFTLTKKDKATNKVLNDAEFYLFDAKNQDAAKKCAVDAKTNSAECEKALKFDGQMAKKFTTTGQGTFTQNMINGTYYLVEVKAPAGYILPFEPQTIEITKTNGSDYNFTATAYNVSVASGGDGNSWFTLPTTGSTGVVLIVLIGAALITAGAVIFFVASKRRKEEEAVA
ncbi:SpaH/EbpB family LPXTG-anchored major pilin [Arcanobacterium hippocoleae]|uniref:SpaH/EbpB family LPXTG-anchored major pilin n=1 Tax=Arcanobacterium hippocoleae TaxID=149017 RepID=UPI003340317D